MKIIFKSVTSLQEMSDSDNDFDNSEEGEEIDLNID